MTLVECHLKKITYLILFFVYTVLVFSCSDPCYDNNQVYVGSSIDLVDNSGLNPISLVGNVSKSQTFGVYYQLVFEPALNSSSCFEANNEIPTSIKIYTINTFNSNFPSGSEITNAFRILNNDKSYPVDIINAKIKSHNHLLLYEEPENDTVHQFIVHSLRNNLIIDVDTTRPIVLTK